MTDLDEWRRERELTEWDHACVEDPQTYADVMAADGSRE